MRLTLGLLALIAPCFAPSDADAGGLFRRRERVAAPARVVTTTTTTTTTPAPVAARARPDNRVAASPMLGTFMPGNYITVRSNGIIGGGYSPLGLYGGNTSMDLYGPFSALRATSAPVNVVVRGYDGAPVLVEGTSTSTPFLPDASPVQYPTRTSNYSAIRDPGQVPRSGNGMMWVDHD